MAEIRLVIAGAAGRMGHAVIREASKMPGIKLLAGLEAADSPAQGKDLGTLAGIDATGARIEADPLPVLAKADALIDFTRPQVSLALADLAAQARIVHIIGTTGFAEADDAHIKAAARHATIVKSGNMSLGVNLLAGLVELASHALGQSFDIEILEMHHRNKADAPSGTALLLGQAAAHGRDKKLSELKLKPHDGITGPRAPGPIGFASLRGGSVVGDHTVVFAGDGERIELTHRAEDRAIFAKGALRAALWGQGKGPGLFDMQDVLGLRRRG
ncbi:MAG: 4-hydroxy-tetrahydrodipicolinate reductase [Alphaproteobacteria bacterium]|nr:4-hydroxy-tetrahydrodipicolinate reductase [Alphaproteobacteria bacterium]